MAFTWKSSDNSVCFPGSQDSEVSEEQKKEKIMELKKKEKLLQEKLLQKVEELKKICLREAVRAAPHPGLGQVGALSSQLGLTCSPLCCSPGADRQDAQGVSPGCWRGASPGEEARWHGVQAG